MVTNDSSDRLEAHYQGKQHQGYLKIRDTIEQMRVSSFCYIYPTIYLLTSLFSQQNRQQQSHNYGRDSRDNYSRQRYDYSRNDHRRDGGRHSGGGRGGDFNRRREGGGGYNDHRNSYRDSRDNRGTRDSRDRNSNNNDDDFAGDIESYSRKQQQQRRSRSPIDRRSHY